MIVLFGIVWHVDGREIAEAQLIINCVEKSIYRAEQEGEYHIKIV